MHDTDNLANALFRFRIDTKFRRGLEAQVTTVSRLLTSFTTVSGEVPKPVVILSVDRGYGWPNQMKQVDQISFSPFLVTHTNLLHAHSFIARSFMDRSRDRDDKSGNENWNNDRLIHDDDAIGSERDSEITDATREGFNFFNTVRTKAQRRNTFRHACGLQEPDRKKDARVLCVHYILPTNVASQMNKWVL